MASNDDEFEAAEEFCLSQFKKQVSFEEETEVLSRRISSLKFTETETHSISEGISRIPSPVDNRKSLAPSLDPFHSRSLVYSSKIESFSRKLDNYYSAPVHYLGGDPPLSSGSGFLRSVQVSNRMYPNFYLKGKIYLVRKVKLVDLSKLNHQIFFEKGPSSKNRVRLFTTLNRMIEIEADEELLKSSLFLCTNAFGVDFDFLAWHPSLMENEEFKNYFSSTDRPLTEPELIARAIRGMDFFMGKKDFVFYRPPIEWLNDPSVVGSVKDLVRLALSQEIPKNVLPEISQRESLLAALRLREKDLLEEPSDLEVCRSLIQEVENFDDETIELIFQELIDSGFIDPPDYQYLLENFPERFVSFPEVKEENSCVIKVCHKLKDYDCPVTYSEPLSTRDVGPVCAYGSSESLTALYQQANSLISSGDINIFLSDIQVDMETTVISIKARSKVPGTGMAEKGNMWSELVKVEGNFKTVLFGKSRPSDTDFSSMINNHIIGETVIGKLGPMLFMSTGFTSEFTYKKKASFVDAPYFQDGLLKPPENLSRKDFDAIVTKSPASFITDLPVETVEALYLEGIEFLDMISYLLGNNFAKIRITSGGKSEVYTYTPNLKFSKLDLSKHPGDNYIMLCKESFPEYSKVEKVETNKEDEFSKSEDSTSSLAKQKKLKRINSDQEPQTKLSEIHRSFIKKYVRSLPKLWEDLLVFLDADFWFFLLCRAITKCAGQNEKRYDAINTCWSKGLACNKGWLQDENYQMAGSTPVPNFLMEASTEGLIQLKCFRRFKSRDMKLTDIRAFNETVKL